MLVPNRIGTEPRSGYATANNTERFEKSILATPGARVPRSGRFVKLADLQAGVTLIRT